MIGRSLRFSVVTWLWSSDLWVLARGDWITGQKLLLLHLKWDAIEVRAVVLSDGRL